MYGHIFSCTWSFGAFNHPLCSKKNYPAVKIHPGKFEDDPGNILAIRSINVRNVAKKSKKTKNLPIILA